MRGSVFDDPGDEKSWHVSQRSESLSRFYADRQPSWYASAVAPFAGAERVLDLGCGPGLALRALLDQGSSAVLGIDRWPAFVANSTPDAPIVAHDLSLPMPFLDSASFDGVFSHYVLDYVSPICVRQVLREAHRVLAPGGILVTYLAAIGLGGGDESRTVAYSPEVMRALLDEAGFEGLDVEASPNGRNTVARARRSAGTAPVATGAPRPVAEIDGDTQLSASFPAGGERVGLELSGEGRELLVSVDLPGDRERAAPLALCVRVLRSGGGSELQLCGWFGHAPLIAERVRVEFPVTEVRVAEPGGEADHVSVWQPAELALEPLGNAYAHASDVRPGGELSEAERVAEGRQVIVEGVSGLDARERLGPGRNRFLVRQATRLDLDTLDREWLAGDVHGVVAMAAELSGENPRELLLWCGWRQCPLYLSGTDWATMLKAVRGRRDEIKGPVVLVDPAVSGERPPRPLPPEAVELVCQGDRFFVLLGAAGFELSAAADLARLSRRLLHDGSTAGGATVRRDAEETLRYLTERVQLMRLRQVSGLSAAEVGRRRWPA